MIIALPDKFYYRTGEHDKAYVKNGILYVESSRLIFENLMYTLTYSLKGYERCAYCGKELEPNKRTLDHMYPRHFGGVSIPDNLVPCCKTCNSTKGSLTSQQFVRWRKLPKTVNREKVYNNMMAKNIHKYRQGFVLPADWVTMYDITRVLGEINFTEALVSPSAVERIEMFFFKHKHYDKPIVVSSNGWVFTGFHILYHAKQHHITHVPAVVMENVIHISHRTDS